MCCNPKKIKMPTGDGLGKCRWCWECRQSRARDFSLRCAFESELHTDKCFITLTYADEHPTTGEKAPYYLRREDLTDFKKRLRKHIEPLKIKTFDCGEYGEQFYRPHFHMLIFGYNFPDKWKQGESKSGHSIYISETLEKLWSHGLVTIQDMTINAARYCALYSAKPKEELPEHLRDYPEFNTVSQSMGYDYFLKIVTPEMIELDQIWYEGKCYCIPQYFLDKYFKQTFYVKEYSKGIGKSEIKIYKEFKSREHGITYNSLKSKRQEKYFAAMNEYQAKLNYDIGEMYAQKKYRAENKQNRLCKTL